MNNIEYKLKRASVEIERRKLVLEEQKFRHEKDMPWYRLNNNWIGPSIAASVTLIVFIITSFLAEQQRQSDQQQRTLLAAVETKKLQDIENIKRQTQLIVQATSGVDQETALKNLEFYIAIGYLNENVDEIRTQIKKGSLPSSSSWRVAASLLALRSQIDIAAPGRNRNTDGTIEEGCGTNKSSDHCPNVRDGSAGIITAMDITHDPANGVDAERIVEELRLSQDQRIKFVIWKGRIFSATLEPWVWRPYHGPNQHNSFFHVSVVSNKEIYDSSAAWGIIGSRAETIEKRDQ